MLLLLLLSLWGVRSEECECTGSNAGLPNSSPHQGTNFGKSCMPWDKASTVCVEDNPPKWCEEKWCYVKEGCTVDGKADSHPSSYENSGLFYSYLTCGSVDYFQDPDFKYEFKGCGEARDSPMDIYFVVDASASIDVVEWQQQMVFLSKLVENGMNVEGDRVGVIQFSRLQKLAYDYSTSVEDIVSGVLNTVQVKGGTKTAQAIDFAMKKMEDEGDKAGNKKVIMLLTDGEPDKKAQPCGDRLDMGLKKKLDDRGILFAVLAIGNKDFSTLDCMVDDPKKNIVVMQDFDHFYEYRDPTGEANLMCVDPNIFTEDEIDVDNSCGCTCRVKGKTSKKNDKALRGHYKVDGGSCACKALCKSKNSLAFSYRTKKTEGNKRNCVCFSNMDSGKLIKSKGRNSQLMGLVDE